MSGLYHYDDNAVIGSVTSLSDAQDIVFQQYWFQEAHPTQRECYRIKSVDGDMDVAEWTATRQELFNRADLNGDGQLNRDESREFLAKVRVLDRQSIYITDDRSQELDIQYERLDRHFMATAVLTSPSDSFGFQDYVNVEKIMMAWYNDSKLEKVGYVRDVNNAKKLSHYCKTLPIHAQDRIIGMQLVTNPDGVESLAFQSVQQPEVNFPDSSFSSWRRYNNYDYGFSSTNWIKFDGESKDFAGWYGYTNDSGDLQGLGIIERDSTCAQEFLNELGSAEYTWISPKPSQLVTKPEYPEEYAEQIKELEAQKELLS